jgi:chorismate mutase/prephenate dehydratase
MLESSRHEQELGFNTDRLSIGINLIKLESRPIPNRDFEFMFYFDLETSVYSDEFVQIICELDKLSENFRYFGSYSESI